MLLVYRCAFFTCHVLISFCFSKLSFTCGKMCRNNQKPASVVTALERGFEVINQKGKLYTECRQGVDNIFQKSLIRPCKMKYFLRVINLQVCIRRSASRRCHSLTNSC
ncbi:uncharacterized protein HD556DRAFT_1334277 [Suillus plorans]|uniref:Secreted protein n=1 Tax=Suillus plorans TaxID=116603 RepID=A0A9P7DSF2_9AGAM|nr:uncharacterized protein HD556DRAFT_1334277 [Suillus plorans]KAG1802057.1 hypothetical protein HD556DRAFT_1334277 [Suillus plorans]